MQAYSEDYLFDAMEALGEAFDCAANRVNLGLPMRSVPGLRAM